MSSEDDLVLVDQIEKENVIVFCVDPIGKSKKSGILSVAKNF